MQGELTRARDAAVRVQEETTPMVAVSGLVKHYPKRPDNAVDGVSFAIDKGEPFGLLGPNGAGKTTTIGVLTTRVRATSGSASIAGVDVRRRPVEARRHFAVVPQCNNLDRSLTARQNLTFHAAYFGTVRAEREQRADLLLDQFGLGGRGGDRVDNYSGGMAQRLMLARALMHEPDVLFLDEPTTGLDPQARLFVWERIEDLSARGMTVFLTTHDMDEADRLCRRIAIMDHGKILALDTPAELRKLLPSPGAVEIHLAPRAGAALPESLLAALQALPGVDRVEQVTPERPANTPGAWSREPNGTASSGGETEGNAVLRVFTAGGARMIAPVAQTITANGATILDLHLMQGSLEDVFIYLTGRALR